MLTGNFHWHEMRPAARLVVPLECSEDSAFKFQVSQQAIRSTRPRMWRLRVRFLVRCSTGRPILVDQVMWITEIDLKLILSIRTSGFLSHHAPTVCAFLGRTGHPRIFEKIAELCFANFVRS